MGFEHDGNGGYPGLEGGELEGGTRWSKRRAERRRSCAGTNRRRESATVTEVQWSIRQDCPPPTLDRRPLYSPQSMMTPPGPAGATPIGRSASRRSHLRARLSSRSRPSSAERQVRLCSRIQSFSSLLSMFSSTIRVWMGTHVNRWKPSQLWSGSLFLVCTSRTTRTDSIRTPNSLFLSVWIVSEKSMGGWIDGHDVGVTYNSRARW